jgi:hypothetical protein
VDVAEKLLCEQEKYESQSQNIWIRCPFLPLIFLGKVKQVHFFTQQEKLRMRGSTIFTSEWSAFFSACNPSAGIGPDYTE